MEPLCRLSKRDWETKQLLGFGDHVPDTATTFVGLGMSDAERETFDPENNLGEMREIVLDFIREDLIGQSLDPYRAYAWNRMRHPTRIIVGSEVSTSRFPMNAAVDARRFLHGEG